ncbi:protein of unknown function [Streptomyces sp. KY75]|nr:protein of unknown function [Streptomyces sp. KY75]CAD5994957.1 protein of unknown function [Streptomyces sp. KY70]
MNARGSAFRWAAGCPGWASRHRPLRQPPAPGPRSLPCRPHRLRAGPEILVVIRLDAPSARNARRWTSRPRPGATHGNWHTRRNWRRPRPRRSVSRRRGSWRSCGPASPDRRRSPWPRPTGRPPPPNSPRRPPSPPPAGPPPNRTGAPPWRKPPKRPPGPPKRAGRPLKPPGPPPKSSGRPPKRPRAPHGRRPTKHAPRRTRPPRRRAPRKPRRRPPHAVGRLPQILRRRRNGAAGRRSRASRRRNPRRRRPRRSVVGSGRRTDQDPRRRPGPAGRPPGRRSDARRRTRRRVPLQDLRLPQGRPRPYRPGLPRDRPRPHHHTGRRRPGPYPRPDRDHRLTDPFQHSSNRSSKVGHGALESPRAPQPVLPLTGGFRLACELAGRQRWKNDDDHPAGRNAGQGRAPGSGPRPAGQCLAPIGMDLQRRRLAAHH